jgi:hypothetical protein
MLVAVFVDLDPVLDIVIGALETACDLGGVCQRRISTRGKSPDSMGI